MAESSVTNTVKGAARMIATLPKTVVINLYQFVKLGVTDPTAFKAQLIDFKNHFVEDLKQYWHGTKLLAYEIRTVSG